MNIEIKPIILEDFEQYKKHINSNFSFDEYTNFLNNTLNENHIIITLKKNNKIIGSATLFIEHKLTYNYCKMAHIENVLINENERGHNYGTLLINKLIEISEEKKCYRIDLICSENLINFYKKYNFEVSEQKAMSIYLKQNFK